MAKQIVTLDEKRKKEFKKDIQRVFRRYGFETGYWVCADMNPTNRMGTTVYMGHTNPITDELRAMLQATQEVMIQQAGHLPI